MKQIDFMFTRFIEDKPRLNRKWQIIRVNRPGRENTLRFYHYHHLIAVFDLTTEEFTYLWFELAADYRGLMAIKEYMASENKQKVIDRAKEGTKHYEANQ